MSVVLSSPVDHKQIQHPLSTKNNDLMVSALNNKVNLFMDTPSSQFFSSGADPCIRTIQVALYDAKEQLQKFDHQSLCEKLEPFKFLVTKDSLKNSYLAMYGVDQDTCKVKFCLT